MAVKLSESSPLLTGTEAVPPKTIAARHLPWALNYIECPHVD